MKRDPCTWLGLAVVALLLLAVILIAVLIANAKGGESNVVYVYEKTNNTVPDNSTVSVPANTTEPVVTNSTTDATAGTPGGQPIPTPTTPGVAIPSNTDGLFKGEVVFGNWEEEYQRAWPTEEELAGFDLSQDWRIT